MVDPNLRELPNLHFEASLVLRKISVTSTGARKHSLLHPEKPPWGSRRPAQGKRGTPEQFGRETLTVGERATMKAKSE